MDIVPLKRCTKCKQQKPRTLVYFSTSKRFADGFQVWCRDCSNQFRRDKRKNDPEYRERLRQKDKSRQEKRSADPIYKGKRNSRNRDKWKNDPIFREHEIERARRDRLEGKTQKPSRECMRRKRTNPIFRERERNKNNERNKNSARREQMKLVDQRRSARKLNLPSAFTVEQWQCALNYFHNRCAVCGRPPGLWHTLAMDHWIPLSSPECPGTIGTNIIPLCHGVDGCNNSKHNSDPIEWLIKKLGKRKAKKKLAEIQAYFESLE